MLNLLFKNATVIDGTGSAPFTADVGVCGDQIVMDPEEEAAERVVDAAGLVLTPGFIDFHSHGDTIYGRHYANLCKTSQGVTTQVAGQCGVSLFPVVTEYMEEIKSVASVTCLDFYPEMEGWKNFQEYAAFMDGQQSTVNTVVLVGHSTLRAAVMGMSSREPSEEEMGKMKALLREAMEQGALGLSTGLIYPPSCFAKTEEMVELLKVVAEYDGFFAVHMRNEADDVVRSVEEALTIGREAGVPVMISHHKICGRKNWGLSKKTMALVEEARKNGQMVTLDQYPYLASMTHFKMCVPPWYFDKGAKGLMEALSDPVVRAKIKQEILDPETEFDNQLLNCGGWDKIIISALPKNPELAGMTVAEAAEKLGKDPFDAYFDLLLENETLGNAIYFSMCDEDLFRIISGPDTTVGSDGLCRSEKEVTHPRAWASFPRAICYFCKENNIMPLEALIHKITQFAAERASLSGKGVIKDGYDADLVLMDYENLKDLADFVHSDRRSQGIEMVVVAGKVVYEGGELTGEYPGKLLHHKQLLS